jgi:hypothetical protein
MMRNLALIMAVGIFGCTSLPHPGWTIGRGTTDSVACFHQPEGLNRWNLCGLRTGETQYECEALALLDYKGEMIPLHTTISVYEHTPNSMSKVLVTNGEFSGQTFYCPTNRMYINK